MSKTQSKSKPKHSATKGQGTLLSFFRPQQQQQHQQSPVFKLTKSGAATSNVKSFSSSNKSLLSKRKLDGFSDPITRDKKIPRRNDKENTSIVSSADDDVDDDEDDQHDNIPLAALGSKPSKTKITSKGGSGNRIASNSIRNSSKTKARDTSKSFATANNNRSLKTSTTSALLLDSKKQMLGKHKAPQPSSQIQSLFAQLTTNATSMDTKRRNTNSTTKQTARQNSGPPKSSQSFDTAMEFLKRPSTANKHQRRKIQATKNGTSSASNSNNNGETTSTDNATEKVNASFWTLNEIEAKLKDTRNKQQQQQQNNQGQEVQIPELGNEGRPDKDSKRLQAPKGNATLTDSMEQGGSAIVAKEPEGVEDGKDISPSTTDNNDLPSSAASGIIFRIGSSTRSRNLVHQLFDRSLLGSRARRTHDGPRFAQAINMSHPPLAAKPVSWIALCNDGGGSITSTTSTSRIDCMAWDPLGVLLAVAKTCSITNLSWIDIFDWDTVCAADRKGRNARARAQACDEKSRLRLDIPPLLQFRIPAASTSSCSAKKTAWIRWNALDPDQLAVPSRNGSVVFCFNISHVEAALATTPQSRIINPPRHSYWEFQQSTTGSQGVVDRCASSCVFVAKDHIVIAFGPSLQCWRYYPKRDPTSVDPKLKWQYQGSFGKSLLNQPSLVSLESIGKEHLIAGSSQGHLTLIQWQRVVLAKKTSSFSTSSTLNRSSPTVLCQWLAHEFLSDEQKITQEQLQDSSMMGIQQIQVDQLFRYSNNDLNTHSLRESRQLTQKTPQTKAYEQLRGRFRIQWVTKCGFVLSLTLAGSPSKQWANYKIRRGRPQCIFQTTPVQTRLASGGSVVTMKKEWSLPTETVACDAGASFLCWQKVAPVTRILPHHDQQVLDDRPSLIRDGNDSNTFFLMLRRQETQNVPAVGEQCSTTSTSMDIHHHSLALPKRRGLPKLVSVDPLNQEWAVVATATEHLYVVSLRAS